MSQTKQKIQIKNLPDHEGKLSHGAAMGVYVNGQLLQGVTFAKFEVKPGSLAKCTFEMIGDLEVEGNVHLESSVKESDLVVHKDGTLKAIALKVLGSITPKAIAYKKK